MKTRHTIPLFMVLLEVCTCVMVSAQEVSSTRMVSERPIAQVDFSPWARESFTVSPDGRRVAWVEKSGDSMFVVVASPAATTREMV